MQSDQYSGHQQHPPNPEEDEKWKIKVQMMNNTLQIQKDNK